jgi:hypothetical protein
MTGGPAGIFPNGTAVATPMSATPKPFSLAVLATQRIGVFVTFILGVKSKTQAMHALALTALLC